MKAYEVAKMEAEIQRGKVMMAIEGVADSVNVVSAAMKEAGYPNTQCSEIGDADGEIIDYFMISRSDKSDFMANYKKYKKAVQG